MNCSGSNNIKISYRLLFLTTYQFSLSGMPKCTPTDFLTIFNALETVAITKEAGWKEWVSSYCTSYLIYSFKVILHLRIVVTSATQIVPKGTKAHTYTPAFIHLISSWRNDLCKEEHYRTSTICSQTALLQSQPQKTLLQCQWGLHILRLLALEIQDIHTETLPVQ